MEYSTSRISSKTVSGSVDTALSVGKEDRRSDDSSPSSDPTEIQTSQPASQIVSKWIFKHKHFTWTWYVAHQRSLLLRFELLLSCGTRRRKLSSWDHPRQDSIANGGLVPSPKSQTQTLGSRSDSGATKSSSHYGVFKS